MNVTNVTSSQTQTPSHGKKEEKKKNLPTPTTTKDSVPTSLTEKVVTKKDSGDSLSESFFRTVTDKEEFILHAPAKESYIKKEAIDSIIKNVESFVDTILNKTIKEISGIVSVYESDKKQAINEEKLIKNKKSFEISKNEIAKSSEVIKTNITIMTGCINRFKREENIIQQFITSCEDRYGKATNDHKWIKSYCPKYIPTDFERLSDTEKKAFLDKKAQYTIEKDFYKAPNETDNILMLSDRIASIRQRIYHFGYEIKNLPEEEHAKDIFQNYHNILELYKKDYDRELPAIKERKSLLQKSADQFNKDIERLKEKNDLLKDWLNKAEFLIKEREEKINKDRELKEKEIKSNEGSTSQGWFSGIWGEKEKVPSPKPTPQELQTSEK